jgi:hypothetical protein
VAIDVAMVRQKMTASGKEIVLMNDGEILKDGGDNTEAGDKFKVVVRPNCDCYVYIVSVDGSGWPQTVFPVKGGATANPVKNEQEYAFPEGPYWFSLDQIKGIETFFVVASPVPRPDLEESMAQVSSLERPSTQITAQVEVAPVVPNGFAKTEAGHVTQVKSESGQSVEITALTYVAGKPGEPVTVTRWFKHE